MTIILRKNKTLVEDDLFRTLRLGRLGRELIRSNNISDLYRNIGLTGYRNVLINGGFDIWQRSSTISSFYADRWGAADANMVMSKVTNDRTSDRKFALQVVSHTTGYNQVFQRIEGVNKLAGKPCVLSFWMKSTSVGRFRIGMFQNFGSGGSANVSFYDTTIAGNYPPPMITAANVWQRFEIPLYIPSVAGKTIGAGDYIQIGIGGQHDFTNITHTNTISEVQLEEGYVATPFESRTDALELSLCQRYFARLGVHSGNYVGFGSGFYASATQAVVQIDYPVAMRTAPSVSHLNTGLYDSATIAVSSLGSAYYGNSGLFINLNVASGGVQYRPVIWVANNTTNAYVDLNSEF